MTLLDIDITGYETILLDRDGTINRQRQGDYVKIWEEFEFLPGVIETIARFSKTAKHIFIVTNQRGVGKGRMSIDALNSIHSHMIREIEKKGGRIDKIYFSIGLDHTDLTRKPNVGMWKQILTDFSDVKAETTLMIGDSDCDIEFAHNCCIDSIRVDKQNVIFIKETHCCPIKILK